MDDFIVHKYRRIFHILVVTILCIFVIIAIVYIFEDPEDEFHRFMSFGFYTIVAMFLAALLGYSEKSSINLKDGKWSKEKQVISLEDYEKLAAEHKKQFSKIYDDWDDCSGCCCTMSVPLIFFMMFAMLPEDFGAQFGDPIFIIVYIIIEYTFLGLVSYKIGYHSKSIKKKNFLKAPEEDEYGYIKLLSQLPDVLVKATVETKEMDEYVALLSTDWRIYIDGLPETTYIDMKMEKIDWPCAFLVGTIENGPQVEERTEIIPLDVINEFCPAEIQYSNDEKGTILECKYNIDSGQCEWDFVGDDEIVKLAKFLVSELRKLHTDGIW